MWVILLGRGPGDHFFSWDVLLDHWRVTQRLQESWRLPGHSVILAGGTTSCLDFPFWMIMWVLESVARVLEVVCKMISWRTKTKWRREDSLFMDIISYWGHESVYSGSDRRSLPCSVLALTVSNSKYLKQKELCQDSVKLPLLCTLEAILWLWDFLAIDFYFSSHLW